MKIAVVGLGSAGIQTLCTLLYKTDAEIISISNPEIEHLGIGESTNPSFMAAIEQGTLFNWFEDLEQINGTVKFGTKYTNWREYEFVNPLLRGNVAVHMDTFSLANFTIPRLRQIWESKFQELEGNVELINNINGGVKVMVDGIGHFFDYVFDCTGFPKELDDRYYLPDMFINHSVVHNIPQKDPEPYTGHIASPSGWIWNVPLAHRDSYGLQFNRHITSVDDAKQELADYLKVDVKEIDIGYSFTPYMMKAPIEGRIIRNGNQAFFLEPMFANSLFMYEIINQMALEYIVGKKTMDFANELIFREMMDIEEIISLHYKGGSIFDTEFWQMAQEKSLKKFEERNMQLRFDEINKFIKGKAWVLTPLYCFQSDSLFHITKNLGYDDLIQL